MRIVRGEENASTNILSLSEGFKSLSLMHTFNLSTCRRQLENGVEQRLANFFYERPDSKYFGDQGPTFSTMPLSCESSQTVCK